MSNEVILRLQADVGGITMEVQAVAFPDQRSINDAVDEAARALDRQKAKQMLREAMADYIGTVKGLAMFPQAVQNAMLDRAKGRAQIVSAMSVTHIAAGKRQDWSPNKVQSGQLSAYDQETEQKRDKFAKDEADARERLPLLMAQIERLRKRIDGADVIDELEAEIRELKPDLAEAAD
jgi:hypothetical protein